MPFSIDQNFTRLTGVISDHPVVEALPSGQLHIRFDVKSLVTSKPYDRGTDARTRDLYTTVLVDFDPELGDGRGLYRRGDRVQINGVLRSVKVLAAGGKKVWKLVVATLPDKVRIERNLFNAKREAEAARELGVAV